MFDVLYAKSTRDGRFRQPFLDRETHSEWCVWKMGSIRCILMVFFLNFGALNACFECENVGRRANKMTKMKNRRKRCVVQFKAKSEHNSVLQLKNGRKYFFLENVLWSKSPLNYRFSSANTLSIDFQATALSWVAWLGNCFGAGRMLKEILCGDFFFIYFLSPAFIILLLKSRSSRYFFPLFTFCLRCRTPQLHTLMINVT